MCNFMDWLRDILPAPGPRPTDDEIENAKKPGPLWRVSDLTEPGIHIRFHASKKLRKWRGYWPEKVATQALADAFDEYDIPYEIEWAMESTFEPPTEDPYFNDYETLGWSGQQDRFRTGEIGDPDIHVLLVDSHGGVTGGDICIAGGQGITVGDEPVESGTGEPAASIHAILHEVGHAMGVPGDIDHATERTDTAGRSWVDPDGRWHRTLMNSTDTETENVCGDTLAPRDGQTVVYENRFCDCAVEHFTR